ncbi:MAG: 4-alpha-glucanotransferase [Methylococcaceae bacterium]|nr:4-alpha-glucanotransferase [Methylococcaceae bacterium]
MSLVNDILNQRRAGILLHITSLPGTGSNGDLGREAYHFVDFLKSIGTSVWQVLPLGVTHDDGSPYQCLSAHAGSPALIDIDWLVSKNWLNLSEQCQECQGSAKFNKSCLVTKAYGGFLERASTEDKADFDKFSRDKSFWLDDFALFMALKNEFNQQCWNQWPAHYKERQVKALNEAKRRLKNEIDAIRFEQYVFYRQWLALKSYANDNGVNLFGDIPIFVAYDSSDVWANREVFKLTETGDMSVVTGVPPDYFSATGQRWGNPHYDWKALKRSGFDWWIDRLRTQMEQFDILRIDHFRGLEAAWEIPASEDTAIHGEWVKAPGKALLKAIISELGPIPLVAEDLGIITPEVEELRDEFNLPGMKILQFAFGGGADNPYLPDHYVKNCVVYTGTHDNDTTVGWLDKVSEDEKRYIYEYLGNPQMSLDCALIHAALSSVANLAIIPMQDVLQLGTEHRMNTPGTTDGNWRWRFDWHQLAQERVDRLSHLVGMFNRK